MNLYIAGPMSGYDHFNFPAFFKAERALKKLGHLPINPARHDKEAYGFDEDSGTVTQEYLRNAMAWDLAQVCRSDGVVVLSGWHKSRGARAEVAAARAIDIPVFILVEKAGTISLSEAHYAGK